MIDRNELLERYLARKRAREERSRSGADEPVLPAAQSETEAHRRRFCDADTAGR